MSSIIQCIMGGVRGGVPSGQTREDVAQYEAIREPLPKREAEDLRMYTRGALDFLDELERFEGEEYWDG